MGLFERLGEKAQRVKRQVDEARTASAQYRCRSCGNLVYSDLDNCPECGSDDLEPRGEPAADESSGDESSGEASGESEREPSDAGSSGEASDEPDSGREESTPE